MKFVDRVKKALNIILDNSNIESESVQEQITQPQIKLFDRDPEISREINELSKAEFTNNTVDTIMGKCHICDSDIDQKLIKCNKCGQLTCIKHIDWVEENNLDTGKVTEMFLCQVCQNEDD